MAQKYWKPSLLKFFFLSGIVFRGIHDTQDNTERERLSLELLMRSNLFVQIIYGEVFQNGRTNDQIMPRWEKGFKYDKCFSKLMIRSCQGGRGVSNMINAFSSNLNAVGLHWKIKVWPFYKTVKVFILKFNS